MKEVINSNILGKLICNTNLFLLFVAFVRSKVPMEVIEPIDPTNVDNFLSSWSDNRVRVLIFGMGANVRLRYTLLAFQYRERAAFG